MNKRYPVHLTDAERDSLKRLIASGTAPARKLAHARLLLKADEGWTDAQIRAAVDISQPTISRARKQFVEEGLEAALNRRTTSRVYRPKLDGAQEARLIALACGKPPEGQARWTLRLLADKAVELEIADSLSYQTVRRTLKKTRSGRIS
jgi:DNA-binding transcriptional ArsR family regulator